MVDYSKHSRFFFDQYQKIQDGINAGTINQWDIVLCSDTQEMILVTDEYKLVPIHSKVLRFTSVSAAETYLNQANDTYQGQIVSIYVPSLGSYQAYIVNQDNARHFYVSAISVYEQSDIDYNVIGHRPIENVSGSIESPVILGSQPTGIYRVSGAYKISEGYLTIFQSYNSDLFTVTHLDDGETRVRAITSSSIVTYVVNDDDGGVVVDRQNVATEQWVQDQGYLTESDVDVKLAALNIFTKEEARQYVEEAVNSILDVTFNERFDTRLAESLIMEDQNNIRKLFISGG